MSRVLNKGTPEQDLVFYIDNGGIGLEEDLQPGIDEMVAKLKELGFVEGRDLHYAIDPEARHFEAAWADRMPQALELVLGK